MERIMCSVSKMDGIIEPDISRINWKPPPDLAPVRRKKRWAPRICGASVRANDTLTTARLGALQFVPSERDRGLLIRTRFVLTPRSTNVCPPSTR
jgi:hypothetical protein